MTSYPCPAKKRLMLKVETSIGCEEKKKRSLENGEKNATPYPPFVKASRIPCDTVDKKKYNQIGLNFKLEF